MHFPSFITHLVVSTISGGPLGFWPVCIFTGLAGLVVLMVILSARQRGQKRRNLEQLAALLGLQSMEGAGFSGKAGLMFGGRYRGRDVRFFTYECASKVNGSEILPLLLDAVEVTFATGPDFILEISATKPLTLQSQSVSSLESVVGDGGNFDEKFTVKSNDPRRAQTVLTCKICDQLVAKKAERMGVILLILRNGRVLYGKDEAFFNDTTGLTAMLDFACDCAEQAERSRDETLKFIRP